MSNDNSLTESGVEWSERVALVTGAGSGIGRAAAQLFAQRGATVVAVDIHSQGIEEVAEHLGGLGHKAVAMKADLTDEAQVERLIANIVAEYGGLDIAFNNAGISDQQHSWIDFPSDQWQRMLNVNLNSVFYCLKHELKQMAAQAPKGGLRGQIVNTSSGAGLIPAPGQPHYTAAKHAVLGLTRSAAQEFGKQGIRVNSVLPGLTETPMMQDQPESMKVALAQMSPTGKLGQPEDIARVAVWLCSPEAQWVNGQAIVADGGGLMH